MFSGSMRLGEANTLTLAMSEAILPIVCSDDNISNFIFRNLFVSKSLRLGRVVSLNSSCALVVVSGSRLDVDGTTPWDAWVTDANRGIPAVEVSNLFFIWCSSYGWRLTSGGANQLKESGSGIVKIDEGLEVKGPPKMSWACEYDPAG